MMKSMKMIAFALMGFVVIAVALNAQTNLDNPKFTITIKASTPEVTLGSDIDISITTTNLTDQFLTFLFGNHGNFAVGFEYFVLDEKGAPVAKYGARYLNLPNGETLQYPKPPGKSMLGGIPPGDSSQEGSKISDIYNFDHPGKYTIQVSRKEESSSIPIYSNTITVTVLPADSKPAADEPPATQQ